MALNPEITYFCEKCQRSKKGTEFYGSKNLEKYPDDGCMHLCKDCMTMHVDNWDPETFLWILQEADVPWIPDEWNGLLAKFAKDPKKMSGKSIIGRYLAKMQLKQYRDFRWKDTKFLQDMQNNKIEQTMKRQGYDAAQIASVIQTASYDVNPEQIRPELNDQTLKQEIENLRSTAMAETQASADAGRETYEEKNTELFGPSLTADELGLTEEDVMYLRLKWGKSYKPEEWVKLEQLYTQMVESYDVTAAGHKDILILVCKTSLKSNQLLDLGDIEGAQKSVRMYDALMKSGKFTAAQIKGESGEFVDSVGELVALCEREGFIPRYYIDQPNDHADEVLMDTKNYLHDLVVDEMNLGNLIENAVRQMSEEESKAEDTMIEDDENLTFENVQQAVIEDSAYSEYNDFLESEEDADEETYLELAERPTADGKE